MFHVRLKIIRFCRYPGKRLSVEINDRIYSNFDVITIWGKSAKDREILKAFAVLTDFSDLPQYYADKIIIEISSENEYDEIRSLLSSKLYAQLSDGKALCLVMNRDATKLNAVKKPAKQLGNGKVNCEYCTNYEFDEEYGCYVCMVDLDEDEYGRFLQRSYSDCPFFRLNDEYKTVRKQN